eukprot:878863-Pyramimonas_sp.AAC.1
MRIGEGWVWLQQGMTDLRNASLRLLTQGDHFVDHSEVEAAANLVRIISQPFEAEGLSPRLGPTVRKARELAAAWPQDL